MCGDLKTSDRKQLKAIAAAPWPRPDRPGERPTESVQWQQEPESWTRTKSENEVKIENFPFKMNLGQETLDGRRADEPTINDVANFEISQLILFRFHRGNTEG